MEEIKVTHETTKTGNMRQKSRRDSNPRPPDYETSVLLVLYIQYGHLLPCLQNAFFSNAEHPRFGIVLTVVSSRVILKGEEILLDYQYGNHTSYKTYFPWYFENQDD